MSGWLVRAGSHGEYKQKFIQEGRIYVTWDGLDVDLSTLRDRAALQNEMTQRYPETKPKGILNWVSQVWPFAREMQKGDLVVLPLKSQPAIQIGELTGDYHFDPSGPNPMFHWRAVRWIGEAVPRAHFSQVLLFTFGAFVTICRVQRNNAESRLAAMRANGWKPETLKGQVKSPATAGVAADDTPGDADLEELANDQIAQLVAARFKGHG